MAGCAGGPEPAAFHEAPDLEACLPATLGDTALELSSTVGHDLILSTSRMFNWPADYAGSAEEYEQRYLDEGLDLDQLRRASASPSRGRDVVWVTTWPNDLVGPWNYELLVWAAGISDERFFADPYPLHEEMVGGRSVDVGDADLMTYEELGGSAAGRRPYLYEVEDHVFLVVTKDRSWAEQAVAATPTFNC